jgi:hypothetical protein
VALVSLALIGTGCTADSREPIGITLPSGGGTTSGGGGDTSSGGSAGEVLVGRWRNEFVIGMSGDFQRVTTTWSFQSSGHCSVEVRTFSVLDGMTLTTTRPCGFSVRNGGLEVRFDAGGIMASFSLSFETTDLILLDGFEFARV